MRRKRGLVPTPTQRVVINHRICEGCGDCGQVSNCLSRAAGRDPLRPQDRDRPDDLQSRLLVPRRRLPLVHDGDGASIRAGSAGSPVDSAKHRRRNAASCRPASGARPTCRRRRCVVPDDDFAMRITGIGGTGVVTVAQVLGTAAMLDGYRGAWPRPDRPVPEGRTRRQRSSALAHAPRPRRIGSETARPTCCWPSTSWSPPPSGAC